MSNNGAFDPETDGLTPGEQHVLALIREGRLDAEIAVRLGVSVGDVKDRIQRILRKLELSERRDLLDPTAERRAPTPATEAEVIIDATGGATAAPRRAAWPARAAKVGAVAALLASGAFAATWAWSLGEPAGGEVGDSSAKAQSTPAPGEGTKDTTIVDGPFAVTATPTVFTLDGVAAPDIKVFEGEIFPIDVVLYVLNTGIAPDPGQGNGLFRVYRLETKTYAERMFPPAGWTAQIMSAAAAADGSDIVVAACTRGSCLGGDIDPDSEATYFRSRDGGITWAVDFTVPRGIGVFGVSRGRVLVQQARVNGPSVWLVVENGVLRELAPPTFNPRYTPRRPYLDTAGKVVWLADAAVLGEDGKFIFALPITGVVSLTASPRGWVFTGVPESGSPLVTFLVGPAGEIVRSFWTPNMLFPAAFSSQFVGAGTAAAGSIAAIGVGLGGTLPAVINLYAGIVQVLTDPFVEPPFRGLANQVIAARLDSFARVNTPGDCLNIREGPSAEAPVLACVPDGVLLSVSGYPSTAEFLPVLLPPDGRLGFGAREYLRR